jgi:choline kinase
MKKKLKVIIIAAGIGQRLRPLTENLPKGLLPIGNTSIIGIQLKVFKSLKLKLINIINGYKKDKFNFKNVKYITNKDYKKNNVLESFFYAKKILNDECIVSYSDIIFKKKVVNKLMKSKADISIVVDTDWKKSYIGRVHHPYSEADKAFFNSKFELVRIGKNIPLKKCNSEFIGMMKLNSKGCEIFKKYYDIAKIKFKSKKFFTSKNIQKSYLTDFFVYLMENKIKINCVSIKSGWMEIDTVEDYVKAQKFK